MLKFQLQKRLRDFTVDIEQEIGAETLVLIGRSGSGKSTVLQMLAGLLTPDGGRIELDERVLWQAQGVQLPPEERHIGIVFQNYALFPHLSVWDNIAYGLYRLPKEERASRVADAIELLGLHDLANAKPSGLSGGEQQRVALARALVTRPQLLLLDEPLSALDVSLRSHVRSELKMLLQKLCIPTLIVTHDYEDARVLADRIAVLQRGHIIQAGTPQEIAKWPANPFVAEFTGTNWLVVEQWEGGGADTLALATTTQSTTVQTTTAQETNDIPQNTPGPVVLSFDPWRVQLAQTPTAAPYEWLARIRDIARLGGLARLTLQAAVASTTQQLLADIPIEQVEQAGYQPGDLVFANVAPQHVRVAKASPEAWQTHLEKT